MMIMIFKYTNNNVVYIAFLRDTLIFYFDGQNELKRWVPNNGCAKNSHEI